MCFPKAVGRHAFRKHAEGQETRNILNAALWDVMSTGLSKYPEARVDERAHEIRTAFYNMLNDPRFSQAITYSPNSTPQVRDRFAIAGRMFREVLGAPTD